MPSKVTVAATFKQPKPIFQDLEAAVSLVPKPVEMIADQSHPLSEAQSSDQPGTVKGGLHSERPSPQSPDSCCCGDSPPILKRSVMQPLGGPDHDIQSHPPSKLHSARSEMVAQSSPIRHAPVQTTPIRSPTILTNTPFSKQTDHSSAVSSIRARLTGFGGTKGKKEVLGFLKRKFANIDRDSDEDTAAVTPTKKGRASSSRGERKHTVWSSISNMFRNQWVVRQHPPR